LNQNLYLRTQDLGGTGRSARLTLSAAPTE